MRAKAITPRGTASEMDSGSRMARASPIKALILSLSVAGPEQPTTPAMKPTQNPRTAIQNASFTRESPSTKAAIRIDVRMAKANLLLILALDQPSVIKSFLYELRPRAAPS